METVHVMRKGILTLINKSDMGKDEKAVSDKPAPKKPAKDTKGK